MAEIRFKVLQTEQNKPTKTTNNNSNIRFTVIQPTKTPELITQPIPTNNIENIQNEYKNITKKIANYGSAKNDNYAEKIVKNIFGSYGKERKSKEYQELIKKAQELRKQIEENSLQQKQTGIEKYLNTVSGGLQTGLKGIESAINKVNPFSGFKTSNDSTALTYAQKKAQAAMEQTKNPITKAGLGVVSSVSQMIPQIAVGNPAGALAVGFANYGGGAYNRAKQEGKTEAQATKYGIAIGALETTLQKALGGLTSVYGKSGLGKISNNVLKKIISNKTIRDVISNRGGEFTEEYLQDILNPIVRNITMGENNKFKLYTPQALESGILGALTVGIIEIPNSLAKASQQTNVQPSTITPTTPQTTQGVAQMQPQATNEIEKYRNDVTNRLTELKNNYPNIEINERTSIRDNKQYIEFYNPDTRQVVDIMSVPLDSIKNKTQKILQPQVDNVENNNVVSKGKEIFGTTNKFSEAGYITTDGELLDFSGKKDGGLANQRSIDHRDIAEAFDELNYNYEDGTDALDKFQRYGNIRLNPESQGMELAKMPTKQQFDKIYDFINNYGGEVIVDFAGENTYSNPTSKEYKQGTSSTKIINDIKEFYKSKEPIETQPTTTPEVATQPETKNEEPQKVIQSSLNADEQFVLNDIKKVKQVKQGSDFYRNIRNLYNEKTANRVTGEFDKSKLNNINLNNELATDLKKNIVDKYNIQKGSKDSALVQKYGEKLISEEELKQQSPKNWQNIIEADKYFRKQYDMLIDKINDSRKKIYPNVEKTIAEYENNIEEISKKIVSKKAELKVTNNNTKKYDNLRNQINNLNLRRKSYIETLESDEILKNKRVEKRQDYYRHFQEMSEGFKALSNIFATSSDISPKMVGISEFTKPNTKFSSITQQRKTNKTKYDAVGGFLNYIPTASYMINIDPQIYKLRKMTSDLREQMGEDTSANKAIQFLTDFTNKLAGKTTGIDREIQKYVPGGRTAIKVFDWFSGRVKSNMLLGNVNSAISQVLNLPQVVAKVKNPVLLTKGFIDAFNPKTDYSKSQFITERYKSDILSQFNNKLIDQPKKLATWMLEALDEKVTKTGWNALYQEALNKNIENPIQYADNNIRDLVAGRGIGEKTLLQESKTFNVIAPFTVEVGNLMRVYRDFGKQKDIIGILLLLITSNLLNKGVKKIGASGKTADFLEAAKDALTEEDLTLLERLGRVGGEVLSNVPLGQQVAALYPEYGSDKLPTRKQLFGENDPTRFGTGSIYSKAITKPITTVVTPYGGSQLEKIKKGYDIISKGGEYKKGKLKYPVETDPLNVIRALTFGSTRETQEFYNKKRTALSEKQTKQVEASPNIKKSYEIIMKTREYNSLKRKYKEKINNATEVEKERLYKELQNKINELYNK